MRPLNRLHSLTIAFIVSLAPSQCVVAGDGNEVPRHQRDLGHGAQNSPLAGPASPTPASFARDEVKGPGVIIESVRNYGAGARAGIQEGDVLLNWRRDRDGGTIDSPFDVFWLDFEQTARGAMTVEGLRGQEPHSWVLHGSILADVRPNLQGTLLASYQEGQDAKNSGKSTQAARLWLAAADESQKTGPPWLQVWFLDIAADLFAHSGEWKAADDTFQTAVRLSMPMGFSVREQLLFDWAQTFDDRSDWDRAQALYQKALDYSQPSGAENISATLFTKLGSIADKRGDVGKAEEYLRKALILREKLEPDSDLVAYSFINLGNAVMIRGDVSQAEEYQRRAWRIFDHVPNGPLNLPVVLDNLGEIARARGDLPASEKYYRQALEKIASGAPRGWEPVILDHLAVVVDLQGNAQVAREYLEKSLAITRKLSPGSAEEAETLRDLGHVAQHSGDFPGAEEDYKLALEIYQKLAPEGLDAAEAIQALGDVARKLGDVPKAEAYCRRALSIREKVAPGSMQQAESLAAVASILRAEQQPDAAAQYYAQAVSALESQTARLGGSEEIRSGFRAGHSQIYRDYVDLLLEKKQPARALEVLERSRARILLEMMSTAHVNIHNGADPSLLEQERFLQQTLAAKSDRRLQLLGDKNKEKQLAAFTAEIEDLSKQYQEVEERLRVNNPAYAALTQPQPLTAGEIQQLLDSDTVLVEYSLGEERSYVFAVTADSITTHELPKREEIEALAQHVFELLQDGNGRGKESSGPRQARLSRAEASYTQSAGLLSQMILAPIGERIAGKRLLIVSEGALQYVPFGALPSPAATSSHELAWTPLLAQHEIIHLPSASVLGALRRDWAERKPAPNMIAVFADPVFSAEDDRVHPSPAGPRSQAASNSDLALESQPDEETGLTRSASDVGATRAGVFPRLRFSRLEADAIESVAHHRDATEALDFSANKTSATSPSLKDYRILHFATHGLVDSQHADLSGLVFSLVDENGGKQDGFVRLTDIYNLDLNADLVVLSACQTALGKEIEGEGLIGMTRGFMYAGARRVVASLWNVDDEATAELMAHFYDGVLRKRQTPAQALQSAQNWLRTQKRWRSPYYWAGFVLQGEWK